MFTFPFILGTIGAKWIEYTTIISSVGAQSFLTVLRAWSGKRSAFWKLLRDRNKSYILKIHSNLNNWSRVQDGPLSESSWKSHSCISSIVENQNSPIRSNIFQYEISSMDNVVLRIISADSQHKRGLTLLFFPPLTTAFSQIPFHLGVQLVAVSIWEYSSCQGCFSANQLVPLSLCHSLSLSIAKCNML